MADTSEPVIELLRADVPRSENTSRMPVVKEVDWKIEPGSFWALGGVAGSGKTDLLLTAAGLQRPLHGDLLLFGRSISQMGEDELVSNRLKVAMVFADGRLFSHLTIAENIALPLEYHGSEVKERVKLALQVSEIEPLADRLPRQVPRALHQRVALARALALSPEVLLLDNPLHGVDQRNVRWWIDFLCAANKGHPKLAQTFTVVVATDDLRPWTDTAREFGVLRERHFEAIGGREQVMTASQEAVRDLLTAAFDNI